MLLNDFECECAEMSGDLGGVVLPPLVSLGLIFIGVTCIFFGYAFQEPYVRVVGIAAFSVLGLVAWLAALKRYLAIADTPTAVLRGVAQGYVELTGTCRAIPYADLLCPGKAPPCVWYYAIITYKRRRSGDPEYRFECSHETFLIEDGTGECVIDPRHAEVLSVHQVSWEDAHALYEVRYLLPGDRLYAIGDMRTLRAADGTLTRSGDLSAMLRLEWKQERRSADLSAVLREWKQDRAVLVQRFDTDSDGDVDLQEWQGAVAAAEREVDARHREPRPKPDLHMMRAPDDGRPYLLSNRHPDHLRRRYKCWAWIHLTVFVATFVWAMTVLVNRAQ